MEKLMKAIIKTLRTSTIVLTLFLALSAFAGGIQLLEGTYAPPVEMLNGSVFKDFTIPGLALGLIAGGSALVAAILLLRRNKFATLVSSAAGTVIMSFEFVEVLVIGSPAGIARTLQIFYFGLGTLVVIASMGIWFLELLAQPHN
jgi:hypothetical protein